MDSIVIFGSGGQAKVVIEIVQREGRYRIAGIIDAQLEPGAEVLGYTVLGGDDELPEICSGHAVVGGVVAIGDNFRRGEVLAGLARRYPEFRIVSAVHPQAVVSCDAVIGAGTVIMAGAVINPGCVVGTGCVLNTNCSLDHDGHLGDYASLGPGAVTGGNVELDDYAAVAIGAVVLQGVRIGAHAVVGAGATVTKNIMPLQVAYGTPARVIRSRKPGDRYL